MREVDAIISAWHRLMEDDSALWRVASARMKYHQDQGVAEDEAAEQAMIDVGWLTKAPGAGEMAAQEYEEAMQAQDLMKP